MSAWDSQIRFNMKADRDYNAAAMEKSGLGYDPGRTLSPEEIAQLNLTPPGEIRDCGYKSTYHWR